MTYILVANVVAVSLTYQSIDHADVYLCLSLVPFVMSGIWADHICSIPGQGSPWAVGDRLPAARGRRDVLLHDQRSRILHVSVPYVKRHTHTHHTLCHTLHETNMRGPLIDPQGMDVDWTMVRAIRPIILDGRCPHIFMGPMQALTDVLVLNGHGDADTFTVGDSCTTQFIIDDEYAECVDTSLWWHEVYPGFIISPALPIIPGIRGKKKVAFAWKLHDGIIDVRIYLTTPSFAENARFERKEKRRRVRLEAVAVGAMTSALVACDIDDDEGTDTDIMTHLDEWLHDMECVRRTGRSMCCI